jgi:hypothetical protein
MNKKIPITVRRSTQKGTHMVQEPLITSAWSGQTFRNQEDQRLIQAKDMMITSAKGTSKIKISSMQKTKIPNTEGFNISSAKGTSRLKI